MKRKCVGLDENVEPSRIKIQIDDPIVHLNVGGTLFVTKKSTLQRESDWLLGHKTLQYDEKSPLFIDADPKIFKWILQRLRSGVEFAYPGCPKVSIRYVRSQLAYFGLTWMGCSTKWQSELKKKEILATQLTNILSYPKTRVVIYPLPYPHCSYKCKDIWNKCGKTTKKDRELMTWCADRIDKDGVVNSMNYNWDTQMTIDESLVGDPWGVEENKGGYTLNEVVEFSRGKSLRELKECKKSLAKFPNLKKNIEEYEQFFNNKEDRKQAKMLHEMLTVVREEFINSVDSTDSVLFRLVSAMMKARGLKMTINQSEGKTNHAYSCIETPSLRYGLFYNKVKIGCYCTIEVSAMIN